MEVGEFEKLLKQAGLTKREFAKLTNMNYNSVVNWGTKNTYAKWVEPFLNYYIKAKKFDELTQALKGN
ncbi:XRE family transcriptional regulator [Campylobacter sp. IFREMER_LSEM_CL1904]|uniref:XRE family transcriptional regulator n=1 Tax=unclassified Campylobacter TaxID=2593542 RepID=UPI0021E63FE4|nr:MULTISPECIES: XRE family transcriptional regulator [unclassified Campylobacter]MCV3428227.1 XRE family transcriptional regulator [Campylobacter sp. IFREMER_LSEM_CL1904]MCV3479973.1 XRE family transcriptional regulator [Campylobacter sp. CNRCH_2015_1657]